MDRKRVSLGHNNVKRFFENVSSCGLPPVIQFGLLEGKPIGPRPGKAEVNSNPNLRQFSRLIFTQTPGEERNKLRLCYVTLLSHVTLLRRPVIIRIYVVVSLRRNSSASQCHFMQGHRLSGWPFSIGQAGNENKINVLCFAN